MDSPGANIQANVDLQEEVKRLSMKMHEVRKEINLKYNVFIQRELSRLETEMEQRIVKYFGSFAKVQMKLSQF